MSIFLEDDIKNLPKPLSKQGFKLVNNKTIEIDYMPSKISTGILIDKITGNNLKIKDVSTIESNLENLFNKIIK